ncbi:hypothetical protein PTB57_001486 [Vibrio parahaemolyticus]|nr:hypothetical protein [Vibrio parahaemolyticus]
MISEKAPPLFLIYLDDTLSSEEQKELLELDAKADLTKDDQARCIETSNMNNIER